MIKSLSIAVRTEWIKIKGLGLVHAGAGLALLLPLVRLTVKIFGPKVPGLPETGISLFEDALAADSGAFAKFFIILYIVVATNRICQIDHKNGGWLLLETQPVSKLNIYLAKYLNIVFLTFLTISFFFLFTLVFTALSQWLFVENEANWALSFGWLLQNFLKLFVSSLGISSFMLFVSVVLQGYIWPFIIGILGLSLNLVSFFRKEFYPYSPLHTEQLAFTADIRSLNTFMGFSEVLSIFWTLSFILIGYWWYREKSFKRAFSFNTKVRMRTLLLLGVLGGTYYFIQQPKQVAPLNATFLSGRLEGDDLPQTLFLIEPEFNQTLATLPVVDGAFSWKYSDDLYPGLYKLVSDDRSVKITFFLSKGDFYKWELFRGASGDLSFVKTNRKAEVDLLTRPLALEITNFQQIFKDNPAEYYKEMNQAWERFLKKLKQYRTVENYTVADDFVRFKRQDMAVNFLKESNSYYKNNGGEEGAYKALVAQLEEELKEPSDLTLSNSNYLAFALSSFTSARNNVDSAVWAGVSSLENGRRKDKLLGHHVATSMEKLPDFQARRELIDRYADAFSDPRYVAKLEQELAEQQVSRKGVPLPEIVLEDVGLETETGKEFKGKYVVMELWSKDSDSLRLAFKDAARRYYWHRKLAFVSVNVDLDQEGWKEYVKEHEESQNLQEYRLKEGSDLLKGVQTGKVPHYILVDDRGVIYEFNVPAPPVSEFHTILRSVL